MDLKALSTHDMLRHSGQWLADRELCAELDAHPVGAVLRARVAEAHAGLAEQVAEQRERERGLAREAKRLARRELGQEGMAGAVRRTLQGLQFLAGDQGQAARYRQLTDRLPAPVMACERELAITRDAHAVSAIESAHTRLARLRWIDAVETLLGTLRVIDLTAPRARMRQALQASIPQAPARPARQRQVFQTIQQIGQFSGR